MRRRFMPAALVLVGLASGMALGGDDLAGLQGSWRAKVGGKLEFSVALEIRDRKVEATIAPKVGPKVCANGSIKVDESTTPRTLDWVEFTTLDGTEVPTLRSIYRLEGDRLILRGGGFDGERPKAFEKGNDGCWSDVLVFRREPKPDVKTASARP